jgi:hypothetical protein
MRRSYMIPATEYNAQITLRTIAAAWKCSYQWTAGAPYAGILSRDSKPIALVYIAESREAGHVVNLPETMDALALQQGNAFAMETGVAVTFAVQMSETIAVLVRKGEPLAYSYEVDEARLVARIPRGAGKFLELPRGARWSTELAGKPG